MLDARVYRMLGGMLFALMCAFVFAGQAGADEASPRPKRVIHGNPVDRRAVEALLEESEGDAEVEMSVRGDRVKELRGKFKIDKNKPVEEAALDFIDRHRNAFGFNDAKRELRLDRIMKGFAGIMDIHYQQEYNGIPIWGRMMRVHLDKLGNMSLLCTDNIPTPNIDTTPLVTKEEALDITIKNLDKNKKAEGKAIISRLTPPEIELIIYEDQLAYSVFVGADRPFGAWRFFVNAKDGSIINVLNEMKYLAVNGSGVTYNVLSPPSSPLHIIFH